jgi:hypothetical protein
METDMNHYLLLLRNHPESFHGLSPQEIQQVFAKYVKWRTELQEAGRLAGSNKLDDTSGRVLHGGAAGEMRITDGPFVESKELIGGYFMVSANSYEEVLELCKDCPHLAFGTVEVRLVQKT